MTQVRVSVAQLRQSFHGCDPDYIREVCHAACCHHSGGPPKVALLPVEALRLKRRGIKSAGGMVIAPDGVNCPAHTDTLSFLCSLHGTGDKPFGCVASPFVLTSRDTLVVRNRYRLLRCYNVEPRLPAYEAFRASLDLLFGEAEAGRLADLVRHGVSVNPVAEMRDEAYQNLRELEQIRGA